jgi:hypothetical protein
MHCLSSLSEGFIFIGRWSPIFLLGEPSDSSGCVFHLAGYEKDLLKYVRVREFAPE